MKILEVKNNLVKIAYSAQDNLTISGFVIIEDKQSPYVAQIMSLKADSGINYAIVKLLFTFNSEGVVKNYNGTIPELDANITRLSAEELLDILPIETPFAAGKLAQQDFILNIDYSAFEKNLLICSDNVENTDILLSNIAKRITENSDKSVIFDTTGTIESENKLVFGRDFKLPLNYDTINFIYEHDLGDVEPASKSVIQDVLIEVQEYSKTLIDQFIPFDFFIAVIDSQAKKLQIPELALLKNRLIKYKNVNAFAQEASDFHSLRGAIRANLSTTLDLSTVDADLQKLVISTVYSEIDNLDLYMYSLVKINNDNADKRLLKRFINSNNKIFTIVACPHNYRYLHDLKEIANNMFLFAPQTIQHDFGAYNVFLNKLNPDECVVFGKATQFIPLIIEMAPIEVLYEYQRVFAQKAALEDNDGFDTNSFEDTELSQEQPAEEHNSDADAAGILPTDNNVTESESDIYIPTDADSTTEESEESEETTAASDNEEISSDIEESEPEEISADDNYGQDVSESEYTNDDDEELVITTDEEEITEPVVEKEIENEEFVSDVNTQEETEEYIDSDNADNLIAVEPEDDSNNIPVSEDAPIYEIEDNDTHEEVMSQDIEILSEPEEIISEGAAFVESDDETVHNNDYQVSESAPEFIDEFQNVAEAMPESFDESSLNLTDDIQITEDEETVQEDVEIEQQTQQEALTEDDLDFIDNMNTNSDEEHVAEIESVDDSTVDESVEDNLSETYISGETAEIASDMIPDANEFVDNQDYSEPVEQNYTPEDNDTISDNYEVNEENSLNINSTPEFEEFNSDDSTGEQDFVEQQNEVEYVEDAEPQEIEPENILDEDQSQVVPIYPVEDETPVNGPIQAYEPGDRVVHPKYGEGMVEKMIKYGNKVLCSINFANGRRLLDPAISQLSKIE